MPVQSFSATAAPLSPIREEATQIQLFKTKNLTFDKAFIEATVHESASKNAVSATNTLNNKTTKEEIYTLKSNRNEKFQTGRKADAKQLQIWASYDTFQATIGRRRKQEQRTDTVLLLW